MTLTDWLVVAVGLWLLIGILGLAALSIYLNGEERKDEADRARERSGWTEYRE